ncbi:MAG: beta-galactosidase [Thermomicrobiales bacterium]
MLFGASYYYEYQPYERLAADVRMMQEAAISFMRVGDSIWARCEPDEGCFDVEWVGPVLDALHAGEINVIFTTPTYAIPPWLHRRHPEVMAQRADGSRARYGGRQNMDFTHPAYLTYAERITRLLLERYASHPAVVGFQVDNETGTGMLHNPNVVDRFFGYLKEKFGAVDRLNEVWGLNYWSHRLGCWEDLWAPGLAGNLNPGYDLEWRRFQASLTTEFLAWQTRIVKEYARPDQFVTQDVVGGHGRGDSDIYQVAQAVDILAMNSQHATQDGLALPADDATIPRLRYWSEVGVWALTFKSDLAWGARRSNFLVTETNPLSVGGSSWNFPAYDGQWRLAAYTYISRGANLIAYWHWHSLHYGHEIYSHGILNHDLEPNRCYHELSRIAHELRQHDETLTDLTPDADVAFLYSQDSKYALENQPCLLEPGNVGPDGRSYQRIFNAFYRAFFDARTQAAIIYPPRAFDQFPVLVAPAIYAADDALLTRLVRYAEQGGHLVLSFRSGYGDEYARARWQRAPGLLRPAVGAGYSEYSNLAYPLPVRASDNGLSLPDDARAEAWADGLELEGAEPLAYYDHPHFGRYPAITSQAFGRGRVTYVGTLPNPALGQALATWVLGATGIEALVTDLPASVRATTARGADGKKLWFLSNWSGHPATVPALPASGAELFSSDRFGMGEPLELGAWDMKIVVEG